MAFSNERKLSLWMVTHAGSGLCMAFAYPRCPPALKPFAALGAARPDPPLGGLARGNGLAHHVLLLRRLGRSGDGLAAAARIGPKARKDGGPKA